MVLFFIQLGIAITSLLFSTFASWYEGSAILDNPWEWKYSTPFSQLLYGDVQNINQISQLDHFVYAAKFQPTFPLIMLISGLYLLILIGYQLFKSRKIRFVYFLSLLAGTLFILSYLVFNSPTIGGQIFFYFGLTSGILCIVGAAIIYFILFKRNTNEHDS
ncbi:YjdJ family protein [Alkalihalobacterium chitinilyticum]|uniref:YjdJ family protein n=1 Tax=Alkalihalobacterium chitinilyticum TaxID=2980103 RepID=A0ABT5VFP9_9BACI|nr:YjdJ family protein [Alkalihalobacterium chitinilyticum]MDE5414277.1 YjdJ family protein [Alkalihalobacterium chitinilyticum]